jgi:hypothetical protein
MLVACRLAGLSALEAYYAGVRVGARLGGREQGRAAGGKRAFIGPLICRGMS